MTGAGWAQSIGPESRWPVWPLGDGRDGRGQGRAGDARRWSRGGLAEELHSDGESRMSCEHSPEHST